MGEVHNAFDERHQRYVALKLLSAEVSADAGLRARFQREAQIVAQLRHPHVIPVHAYGEIDERLYIDMRLVEGADLATILEDGAMTPERAVDIVAQVAGALDAAHAEGLVHRDVKPSNVLVARGSGTADFAYLCDFGIARSLTAPALTQDAFPVGTLAYMAPERFTGGQPAASGDIYALTCVLFECLTGQRPFDGGELPELMYAHLDRTPPKPSEVAPSVPYAFDGVVARGLAKDPAQRYSSASELAAAARAALTGRVEVAVAARAEPHRSRRSRRVVVPALAVAALLATSTVVVRQLAKEPTGLGSLGENSVGMVDAASGRLVRSIAVDPDPSAVASGFGAIWTVNTNADSVSRIDPRAGTVTRVLVQSAPSAITIGSGSVWVANSGSGTVTRIDPDTYRTQSIAVGTAPGGIAVDHGVWVTNTGDATVSRIDPEQNRVVRTIAVGGSPGAISGGHGVWVANATSNTVSRIDPDSDRVVQTIRVGNDPEGIRVARDGVWVANALDGTVSRISTTDTSKVTTIGLEPGAEPTEFASAAGRLWVVSPRDQSLDEIDSGVRPRLVRTLPLGVEPSAVTAVAASGALWVTGTITPALHRGGVLHLRDEAPDSIDPSYGGTKAASGLLNSSYDGLAAVRRTAGAKGAEIVPDLAASLPTPTDGGRTYAFRLRSGITWSDGREVTVADVRRGLERSVLAGISPLGREIVGARSCTIAACDIAGISIDAALTTITVRLVRPNPAFLEQLATWSPAVPADTPLAEQTRPVPATGPYEISSYAPGKAITLRRNPHFHAWSADAQPPGYPDTIDYRIAPGGSPLPPAEAKADVALVAAGRADWTDARFAGTEAGLSARFGDRLHLSADVSTLGVALNTRLAPFDDVRVRRALNLAVDRVAAASAWPSLATPTCQILPPGSPGYRPYCPYTLHPDPSGTWTAPDVVRAQALVTASGTRGMRVSIRSLPNMAAGVRPVVTALRDLGYRVTLKAGNPGGDFFGYVEDSSHPVQATFIGWGADDPSGGDFVSPLFACGSFRAASPLNANFGDFCDPRVERLIGRATRLESSSRQAANDVWARVDRLITDRGAWVPLVNGSWADTVSRRVRNYVRNPFVGVLFDQMWLT